MHTLTLSLNSHTCTHPPFLMPSKSPSRAIRRYPSGSGRRRFSTSISSSASIEESSSKHSQSSYPSFSSPLLSPCLPSSSLPSPPFPSPTFHLNPSLLLLPFSPLPSSPIPSPFLPFPPPSSSYKIFAYDMEVQICPRYSILVSATKAVVVFLCNKMETLSQSLAYILAIQK